MENYIEDNRIHEGHRARMRAKLLTHGQDIFDTYELLEMLLYHVIPYKDTNPVAKRLLYAFGGLDGVFRANREELVQVSGVGERTADFLISVGRLSAVIGAEILPREKEDFADYETVGRFFVRYFSGVNEKCVVALYLDNNMRPIELKRLFNTEYESAAVRAKPFLDAALLNHASVIISAHNHPFGPFYPSQGDRATNNLITSAIDMVGLLHAEHYIICGDSYAGIGSINNFTKKFSQIPAVGAFMESKQRADRGLTAAKTEDGEDRIYERVSITPSYNVRDFDYFVSLLSVVCPKDAGEIAYRLLTRYQTIENVITAASKEITSVASEKLAFYVKLLGYITSRRKTDLYSFGRSYTEAEIAEYMKAMFIGASVERIYLLTFDQSDRLMGCKPLGEGTVNSSEILPRKAIEVAVSESASSVAIAHNHPFGNPTPSNDDIKFTNVFETLFSSCEIGFSGHYIVAGQRCELIMSDNSDGLP